MDNQNQIIIKRTINAPPELVFKAWTDPVKLRKWWGPKNVTIPECELDPRVGGRIYIVMEAGEAMGPYQGTRWPMLGEYTVVEPNSKLYYNAKAWTEGEEEETTIDQSTELTLKEKNGKTDLKIKATIHKFGPGAGTAVQGMQYGFTEQLEKLDEFLGVK